MVIIYKVKGRKNLHRGGGNIFRGGRKYFPTIIFHSHLQMVAVGCLGPVVTGALHHGDQASFGQLIQMQPDASIRHLAQFRQPFVAWEAFACALVVVIRQPIKHDLGGWFQPRLLHC